MERSRTEMNQLLNSIVEVSQSIARMPCPPEEKEEVLDKVKVLFSSYNSIAGLLDSVTSMSSASSKSERPDLKVNQTAVKEKYVGQNDESERLSGMQGKIIEMERQIFNLGQKLNSLERTNNEFEQRSSGLRTEFAATVSAISQMRTDHESVYNRVTRIENKSNDLEVLQNRVETISAVVESRSSFGSTVVSLQDELLKIHQEMAGLEQLAHKKALTGVEDPVAFTAIATTSSHKYKPGEIIKFPNVLCNVKECFDSTKGMFKSDSSGLYVFSTSINTNSDGDFTAAIQHNGNEVASFGTPGNQDLQTGVSVVLLLQKDDTVCIKVTFQSDNNVGVEVGGGFSNFIGYKLT